MTDQRAEPIESDTTEYVRPGTCVWKMGNGHGCGRDAVRFLRVVPGEPRWYLCGIHAAAAERRVGPETNT